MLRGRVAPSCGMALLTVDLGGDAFREGDILLLAFMVWQTPKLRCDFGWRARVDFLVPRRFGLRVHRPTPRPSSTPRGGRHDLSRSRNSPSGLRPACRARPSPRR